jgi:hypothetical protein
MAKPEDAVVPILRNIRKKLGEFEARFERIESKIDMWLIRPTLSKAI